MKTITEINESEFEQEVLNAGSLVVGNFYAPWSRHSQAFTPVLEQVAAATSAKFVKVNASKNTDLCGWYGVDSLPTLLFFRDGIIAARIVGETSSEAILAKLESLASPQTALSMSNA